MNFMDDERGRLGQGRAPGAGSQTKETALLAGQERVTSRDEPGETRGPSKGTGSPVRRPAMSSYSQIVTCS